jgi:hypothetical protein
MNIMFLCFVNPLFQRALKVGNLTSCVRNIWWRCFHVCVE